MTSILGPAFHWSEPGAAPVPPTPGRVGIQFDPANAILPGGIVQVQLLAPVAPTDELPVTIRAFYVPSALIPSPMSVDALVALTGLSMVAFPVPTPPPDPLVTFPVTVAPPPAIGSYLVQTVLDYAT